jgi:hypothetical protein
MDNFLRRKPVEEVIAPPPAASFIEFVSHLGYFFIRAILHCNASSSLCLRRMNLGGRAGPAGKRLYDTI